MVGLLPQAFLSLRRDPRLLHKLPPYLSLLCILGGVIWLFLLPLNEYSRQTYISENALLPGQVHAYFGGSEHNILRAYKHEVDALADKGNDEIVDKIGEIFKSSGLKVARQRYSYTTSGIVHEGENVYSILHAPRGDATEAIVLVAAWRNMDDVLNQNGVALLLTLARYFKRWSLWSKDIIFLVTPDSLAGPQAWVSAYHSATSPSISPLPLKSGALQGAIAIDYPFTHRFESLHISYDGVNGQLPNLDLFNTAVSIASGQLGIRASLQRMWEHDDSYNARLTTMLRGMLRQGLGVASGPHSVFMPYHVDAVTLTTVGEGWQDEMAMGRVVESIFRSLNNLLEHLHQSFFFYLLMQTNRFVSIGTYLPSAMAVAGGFTVVAIAGWIASGRAHDGESSIVAPESKPKEGLAGEASPEVEVIEHDGAVAVLPPAPAPVERDLFLPLAFVLGVHALGLIPLYLFNHAPDTLLVPLFHLFTLASLLLPTLLSFFLFPRLAATSTTPSPPNPMPSSSSPLLLLHSLSCLLLGMFLSTLSTLNFSLALLTGLLSSPLAFVYALSPSSTTSLHPLSSPLRNTTPTSPLLPLLPLLTLLNPPILIQASAAWSGLGLRSVLCEAAFAWGVMGVWTQVVVWCVWWPAWVLAGVVVWGGGRGSFGWGERVRGEEGREGVREEKKAQ